VDSIELALIQAAFVLREDLKKCLLLLGALRLFGVNEYGIPCVMERTETSTIFAPLATVKCAYKFNDRTGLPGINPNHRRLKDGISRND
jgi:hypothetical protein